MKLTDQDIEAIARRIAFGQAVPAEDAQRVQVQGPVSGAGMYHTIDEAVEAARIAQRQWVQLPLAKRRQIIATLRKVLMEHATILAKSAHEETGLGRWQDKVLKNELVIEKTPGIEDLQPTSFSGDFGFTLVEPAPFGVIGSITPTTNPTSTIICNTIGMIAAGNGVAFNVHPNAKRCSAETVVLINNTIAAEGGPSTLITTVFNPTIESAQALMRHEKVQLVVVTGGPGVVRAAQQSGKRAICAGPGNPPAVIDETADIARAANDLVEGASLDNNIICVLEKEVVVVDAVADNLIQEMQGQGAYLLTSDQLQAMRRVIFKEERGPRRSAKMNPDVIGQNANRLLAKIGVHAPDDLKLIIAEVPEEHPLLWTEQLSPILPITRVSNADRAIDLGIEMEGGRRHTAVMHSKHIDRLTRMARDCDCSIFVKNGRAVAGLGQGGEGYTSFTISSPTGEGLTGPRSFSRWRRCTLVDGFRIT